MMNAKTMEDARRIADIYDDVIALTVYKYEMPDFLWIRKHWAAR